MVKQIQSYEDSSGKLHRNAFDAHRAELAMWFKNSLTVNEGQSVALVNWLTERENTETLLKVLQEMHTSRPPHPTPALAPAATLMDECTTGAWGMRT